MSYISCYFHILYILREFYNQLSRHNSLAEIGPVIIGYENGVEEIFFNIWRKRREVDFKFLGKEYEQIMADWVEQEKKGELDTRPPPSPEYSNKDCDVAREETAKEANDEAPEAWSSSLDNLMLSCNIYIIFLFLWCNGHKALTIVAKSTFIFNTYFLTIFLHSFT